MIPEDNYEGSITEAWLEIMDSGDLLMCYDINISTGENETANVTARHVTAGQYGEIGRKVAELVGLEWPGGLRNIHTSIGKTVPVRIKHKESGGQTYENAYIIVGRTAQPATTEQVNTALAKLEAKSAKADPDKNDGLPF